jgi:hypothetical protein
MTGFAVVTWLRLRMMGRSVSMRYEIRLPDNRTTLASAEGPPIPRIGEQVSVRDPQDPDQIDRLVLRVTDVTHFVHETLTIVVVWVELDTGVERHPF